LLSYEGNARSENFAQQVRHRIARISVDKVNFSHREQNCQNEANLANACTVPLPLSDRATAQDWLDAVAISRLAEAMPAASPPAIDCAMPFLRSTVTAANA
jgi:hypothetical protein